jgi:cbb3-type cytochrome oxidase maturation protein
MTVLYLLIPLAVILMGIAIAFFLWTVRTGQYDDLEGPAHRILMDDDDPKIPHNAHTGDDSSDGVPVSQAKDKDRDNADR